MQSGIPRTRREQANATRELLLLTAERLYAERGLAQVSNRQIVEAAGQANNSALSYHVGTRTDIVHAIASTHGVPIADRTRELVEGARGSSSPRDHVASLVLPYTEHLATLGTPSWFARFTAQVSTDPAYAAGVRSAPFVEEGIAAVWAHVPDMPASEAALRAQTARVAIIHTCAEQERAAADTGTPADWQLIGNSLTDAVTGLLLAPRHTAITVSRLVEAPAERVFAYLADPANHPALDTSGMLRGAGSGPITHVGQVFKMNMHNDFKGDHQVANHVVAYEPGKTIGWAPAEPGQTPAGHTYTWHVRPVGPDRSEVTQVHDWSAFTHTDMLAHLPVVNHAQLRESLDKLAENLDSD